VNCILQDKKGLLWFGTNDGLSRYDGYSFKTYRNIPSDPESISENNISAITEDKDGNIWIGTLSGFINIYDPLKNKFSKYKLEFYPLFTPPAEIKEDIPPCYAGYSSGSVTVIYSDKNEFIWFGTFGSGLFRFDPYENSLVHYYYSGETNTVSSDYILSIAEDNNGNLWIATFTGGLNKITMKIDPNTREEKVMKFSAFVNDKNLKNSISDNRITSLKFDAGKLWICTFGGGLNFLRTTKGANGSDFVSFKSASQQNSLSSNFLTIIDSDKNGNLWIGTFGGGLNKLNIRNNYFTRFKNNPLEQNSIDNNDVVSLLADKNGLIWTGTFNGYGINKLNPERKKFYHYKSDPLQRDKLTDNVVTAFAEDSAGNIWIGTYKGGLNKFNRKEKTFSSYKYNKEDNKGITSSHITCLLTDRNNKIWAGTYNSGITIFDPIASRFKNYKFDKKNIFSISSNRITSIIGDKNGEIWIGTSDKGLNKVSTDEKGKLIFLRYQRSTLYPGTIPSDNIREIFKDKKENLWVVSGGGYLSKFDYQTNEFTSYEIDPKNLYSGLEILSLCEDDSDNFWIGTNKNGLFNFNNKTGNFSANKNPFILRNKSVAGILSCGENLWISTNYGLIRYNHTDESSSSYNVSDGLQSLKFNSGAYFRAKNGEMFFGGINGFNSFFPDSMKSHEIISMVIITSFEVLNREIPVGSGKISLSSLENSFSIYFNSTDYADPSKNEYLFTLDGYDNEWNYAGGNNHSAEYKDVPPGTYVFKVKAAGSLGKWADKLAQLTINIPIVFWKSWWFILISVLIFGSIISYFVYYRIRQFLLIEKLKTKLSADLHDSVGSGLTEISLLCEIVQRNYKNELNKSNPNLILIAQKSRELIDNMSDIVWLVNPKANTLYDLILRLKDIYSPILNSLGVNFKVDISDSIKDRNIQVEKRQNIYLIFKEGINNSIKYSRAKNISLNLELVDDSYRIILKDDGCGFEISSVRGNGLINMKRRAENIGADFSIQSIPGKGTIVILKVED
jgi:ligand-binding sensor domain-containing protein/two-component sensor histidine kinase